VRDRMIVLFKDRGYQHDVVEASVFAGAANPARIAQTIKDATEAVNKDNWSTLLNAYARCCRIIKNHSGTGEVDASQFVEPQTQDLYKQYQALSPKLPLNTVTDLSDALTALQPAIDAFFDNVLVMAEDEKLKNARLNLLSAIAKLPEGLIDLSKLDGF